MPDVDLAGVGPNTPPFPAPLVHLTLLGQPQLHLDGHPVACDGGGLRILAVLALDGPRTRPQVGDLLWEGSTRRVQQSFRTALWQLRQALGEHGTVLQTDGLLLRLDLSRVHVDALLPPRDVEGLLTFWREFMTGFRHRGSNAWLEWASAVEERLLEAHVEALLHAARQAAPDEAARLLRRALDLAPEHPDVVDCWNAHGRAPAEPSDETLLRTLERTTRRLWAEAQGALDTPPEEPEDARLHRAALLDRIAPHVTTAFVPRRSTEAADWSREVLSTYRWREREGAEWIARQFLRRHPGGLPAALALGVLANLAIDSGQYTRGRRYAEQALTLVPEPTSEVAFTAAYSNTIAGHHERAARIAHAALRTLPARDTPAMLYGILARAADARQQYRAARHWHELALRAAYDQDDPYVLPQVISFMLWHHNITGDPDRSLALAREGLTYGAPNFSSHLVNSMGFSHLLQRRFDAAHDALAPQRASENVTGSATAHTCSALALHFMGERDEADDTLHSALDLIHLTENGGVKYEWALAALTVDPEKWREPARQAVQGVAPADPTVRQWYERFEDREG